MSVALFPFEIHLTTGSLSADQVRAFVRACEALQAKPLLIELARGQHQQQPMLSKVLLLPDLPAALAAATADAELLGFRQLPVQRVKIEVPADYPYLATPAAGAAFRPYYEWHGRVPYEQVSSLLAVCTQHGAHLSRNALKDAAATRFVTLREFGPATVFRQRLAQLQHALQPEWPIQKQQAEYCLYDSNSGLDQGWLPN
ncbi:hypothetical protein [Hymenobacter cellulosilyticus]|uniref:Uncharacterized protein n=1 Tax=Hymenobacter cellulosilyticus TaxID=2932248 RepID=A0A8T9Q847_9BACT|nr:hypothetical protein [Hymenobacter cellulosilyticus]UOQ71960.1 hypothetical protein MUN79_25755 [Hymenobacter cellulosilyticus]